MREGEKGRGRKGEGEEGRERMVALYSPIN